MKGKRIKIICIIVAAVLMMLAIVIAVLGGQKTIYAVPSQAGDCWEESYREYLDAAGYEGVQSDKTVTVNLENYTESEKGIAGVGVEGILTEDFGTVTWSFQVEESGFYNLELGYIALPGTTSDIQRKVYIDGEIPYDALGQVVIKRWWQDSEIRMKNNDEIRPGSEEIYVETKWFVEDYQRRNAEPLVIYLEEGKHSISMEAIKEPLEITSMVFRAAEAQRSYAEVLEAWKALYNVYDGSSVICQAERREGGTHNIVKSSSSINIQKNYSDSELQPYHPYKVLYNTIGASSWAQPGESISWQVEVQDEGLYTLTFKGRQNRNRGVTSYRKVYINGEVPYEEMNSVGFLFTAGMNNYTIADEAGEAYLFYLEKGINTITLENVMGSMGGIISQVEECMEVLNQTYLDVIRLTGQVPDKFIDYEIGKKLPNFVTDMETQSQKLQAIVEEIVAITGEKGENTSLLEKMALEAASLAVNPESVTEELNQLKSNISAMGTWLVNVANMPLEIDYIVLSGTEQELPKAQESFGAGVCNGIIRFASTFFVKSSQITENAADTGDNTIKVWMASFGREQAQMIQNMIDESFTPEKDISVNLQLIPVDVVLRAALAGNGPDVVIGLGQSTMQDFAMREAVMALSDFEDYQQVSSRFYDSILETASFQEKYYGMPEQATFMMMFVRNDILESLGAEAPQTWEEFRELIPVLQKNNYNAYIPNVQQTEASVSAGSIAYNMNLYLSMVKQQGGEIYTGEGSNYGVSSALAEDCAMTAFKEYTDFFVSYGLDVQVDFTNRFRTGEIPIGIAGYTTFNQLEIFAPEIKGLWSFYPVPGVETENGEIDRSFVVDTVHSVIMESSDNKEDSWEFVKWWTDTETQLSFANSLEALMGTSARYAAADPEVLRQLPWSNSELECLLNQYKETTGISAVPGNYMTTRMIQYSFNEVVNENANPREALYLNLKAVDEELMRKRTELHLSVNESK